MSQVWWCVVHAYLLIPYWKGERHAFLYVHHLIPWWSIAAVILLLPPIVGVIKFGEAAYQRALARIRMICYHSLWGTYLFWILLPWPRVAVVIWAFVLWRVYTFLKRRRAYFRSLPVPSGPSGIVQGSPGGSTGR